MKRTWYKTTVRSPAGSVTAYEGVSEAMARSFMLRLVSVLELTGGAGRLEMTASSETGAATVLEQMEITHERT